MLAGWLLTIVFTGTALWFLVGCARPRACTSERVTSVAHVVMGLAMVAMVWNTGLPAWLQVAFFASATVWFAGLATVPHQAPDFRSLHHALMAAAMVWMVVSMSLGHHVVSAATVVSAVFAWYFLLAALPFFYGVVRRRPKALDAVSHAAMSLGAGVLLLGM
ncbi:DUF5134 domain-containing protein [Actinocrispum sp. NPDC049592]|uniref:DUF5134 domain-containing protein n=1 Tax=Actinocrispum sp. NPDC049592 TaxID=3154835 RepID=UPI0034320CC2